MRLLFLSAALLLLSLLPLVRASNGTCKATWQCDDIDVCYNDTCGECQTDDQCHAHNNMRVCKAGECRHKQILPINWRDGVLFMLLFLGGAFAAGGGVGGGGIFVPILIILGGFITKEAVPISNALIAGASIANYLQLFRRRHPRAARPLIYYDIALLMQPATLSGTILGVLFYSMFPEWLILALLIIVLLSTVIFTTRKAWALYKSEKGARLPDTANVEMQAPQLKATHADDAKQAAAPSPELVKILEYEKRIPWVKIVILFLILGALTVLAVAKGGTTGKSPLGVKSCSKLYWGLVWLPFALLVFVTAGVSYYLIRLEAKKSRLNYAFQPGDVRWTWQRTLLSGLVSVGAGVISSLVGIGGGMILGPLLLSFGVLPDVTAATSSFMILFTAVASIVQYAILKRMIWSYALPLLITGFGASLLGQVSLSWLVRRYNRKSYIVFLIVIVLGLSTIMMIVLGSMNLSQSVKAKKNLKFSSPCD